MVYCLHPRQLLLISLQDVPIVFFFDPGFSMVFLEVSIVSFFPSSAVFFPFKTSGLTEASPIGLCKGESPAGVEMTDPFPALVLGFFTPLVYLGTGPLKSSFCSPNSPRVKFQTIGKLGIPPFPAIPHLSFVEEFQALPSQTHGRRRTLEFFFFSLFSFVCQNLPLFGSVSHRCVL